MRENLATRIVVEHFRHPARMIVVPVAQDDRARVVQGHSQLVGVARQDLPLARVKEHVLGAQVNPIGETVFGQQSGPLGRILYDHGDLHLHDCPLPSVHRRMAARSMNFPFAVTLLFRPCSSCAFNTWRGRTHDSSQARTVAEPLEATGSRKRTRRSAVTPGNPCANRQLTIAPSRSAQITPPCNMFG
jgi:hypothetical protein